MTALLNVHGCSMAMAVAEKEEQGRIFPRKEMDVLSLNKVKVKENK